MGKGLGLGKEMIDVKIGFIGLGVMGRPMASNLLKGGRSVTIFNRSRAAVAALVQDGAEAGRSPRDVAERCDVVITMLPDSPDVRSVLCGPDGILEGLTPGKVVVDMSSIDPIVARELCALVEERGCGMLDAPVSGGQEKAEKGTLSIMVGGREEVYERVRDILDLMGKSLCVGPSGAGQVTKLVNQTIVAANIAAVAEGLAFAKRAGADPERVFRAIRGGLAGSQCLEDKAPRMLEGRYEPGFRIELHVKDLNNVLAAGRGLHVSMPLASQVMEMMQNLMARGCGPLDHGALGRYYELLNGVSLKE